MIVQMSQLDSIRDLALVAAESGNLIWLYTLDGETVQGTKSYYKVPNLAYVISSFGSNGETKHDLFKGEKYLAETKRGQDGQEETE